MSISIVKLLRSLAEEIDLEDKPKQLQAGTGKYRQLLASSSCVNVLLGPCWGL